MLIYLLLIFEMQADRLELVSLLLQSNEMVNTQFKRQQLFICSIRIIIYYPWLIQSILIHERVLAIIISTAKKRFSLEKTQEIIISSM